MATAAVNTVAGSPAAVNADCKAAALPLSAAARTVGLALVALIKYSRLALARRERRLVMDPWLKPQENEGSLVVPTSARVNPALVRVRSHVFVSKADPVRSKVGSVTEMACFPDTTTVGNRSPVPVAIGENVVGAFTGAEDGANGAIVGAALGTIIV